MSVIVCILLVAAVLLLAFGYYASFFIDSKVYVKAFCRGQGTAKKIAITFDDGPEEPMTARVLDVLARHHVRAAFFLIGEKAERCSGLVRRMVEEGHTVGSHSFRHAGLFPFGSRKKIADELEKTRDTLKRITGRTVRLFRPPFGVTNPAIAAAIREGGYQTVGWSVRAFDTRGYVSRKRIRKRLLRQLHPGAVVLLHDRCGGADELVESFIVAAKEKGYEIVGLDELSNMWVYEN